MLVKLNKTQIWLSEASNIHKNRISKLANEEDDPKPDEIVLIDKALQQNRKLVLKYCSRICPAGKYAGYQFSEMDINKAGMSFLDQINDIVRSMPKITKMLCKGQVSPLFLAKLRQLRFIIMAIETQATSDTKASCRVTELKKFSKRKTDYVGAQSVR